MKNANSQVENRTLNRSKWRPGAWTLLIWLAWLALPVAALAQSDATLADLNTSEGTLTPAFASGTFNYTVSVPYTTTSITVTPTATDGSATITVNGEFVISGNPSGAISLSLGANVIETVVVSQDTTAMNTYTLTVTRTGRLWDGGSTDIGTAGDGASQGGNGTWDTTIQNWDQGAGLAHVAWNNASKDTAVFGGTAGTVTLGTGITVGGLSFETGPYTVTGNTLTFGTDGSIFGNQANQTSARISSTLAGSAAITKTGSGTVTLNGSAVNTFNGGLGVNGGTLLADFANLATPTDLIDNGNTLTLGGGILSIKGKNLGATSQTLGNVTVNAGGGRILGDKNGGTSTTVNLGSLTATAAGGSLVVGAGGTAANSPVITTTSNTNATGIYGGRVVFFNGTANTGYDWATTLTGSSPYTLSAYSGYTPLPTSAGDSAMNYNWTASSTLDGSFSVSTLKMATTVANQALALGANLLTIDGGGLLVASGINNSTITISGTAGATSLTAGSGSSYDLVIHQFATVNNGLNIGAVIGDNVEGGTHAVNLVKAGNGTLALSGVNTYSGNTYVNAGILDLGNVDMTTFGGNNRNIYIAPGAILKRSTFNSDFYSRLVQTDAEVGLASGSTSASVDFSATGANLPNAFFGNWAGNGAKLDYTTGTITPANNTYRLGFPGCNGMLGIGSSNPLTDAESEPRSLIVGGNMVELVGTGNTFSGDTVIRTGAKLLVGNDLALQNSALNLGATGDSIAGTFGCATNATGPVTGNTVSPNPTFGGLKGSRNLLAAYLGGASYGNNGRALDAAYVAGFTLNVGAGKSCTYSGVIANFTNGTTLTKTGEGTQVLSGANTYTGTTTVNAGTLTVTGQLTGGGAVTVNDGAILNVSGRYSSPTIAGPGDLTLGSCTLGFDNLFSTNVAPVNAGNVVVNGTVTVNLSSNLVVGQLPLIKYSTGLSGAGTFALGPLPDGVSATLVTNTLNQSLDLDVTVAPAVPVGILADLPVTTSYRFAGGSYSLSVVAIGSAPVAYSWSHDGTPVGSNSPTLTLTGLVPSDSGGYSVTVTNSVSSVQSATNNLVVVSPSTYEDLVLASGPTAFWPLNEASGPTAFDYVTYSNYNGAYSGSGVTYSVAGPASDSVVTLDGVSGAVTIPFSPALNPSSAFSVEMWVNPAQVPSPTTVYVASSVQITGNRSGWYLAQDTAAGTTFGAGSAFVVRMFNLNGVTQTIQLAAPVTVPGWYHLVLTYDGTTAALYENGVLATNGAAGYVGNVSAPFTIGMRSDGLLKWPGSVGGVAVYGRALSSTEVAQHSLNAPVHPVLNYTWSGGVLTLDWTSGTLQAAPEATGTYTNVPDAVTPYPVPLAQPQGFFRLKN